MAATVVTVVTATVATETDTDTGTTTPRGGDVGTVRVTATTDT